MGKAEKPIKEKKQSKKVTNDVKKGGKLGVSMVLILISVVPLLLAIAVLSAVSVYMTKDNLETQVENTLQVAASNLSTHCSGNEINGGTVMDYNEYLDCLKDYGIEMGIIMEGGSGTSSIRNESDFREKEIEFKKDFVADKEEIMSGIFSESVTIAGEKYFGYYLPIITDGEIVGIAFAGKSQDDVNNAIYSGMMTMIIIAVVLAVVFAAIAVYCGRYMKKPLKIVGKRVAALSSGDLKVQPSCKALVRELDELIDETTEMQESMSDTIGKVKDVATEVGYVISEVSTVSDSSAGRAKQITNAMEELSYTAGGMAENVQNINVQMIEVGTCINEMTEDVDVLYQNSDNLLKINDEARTDMNVILENSKKSVVAVNDIASQIKETNYSINEIEKAVGLILEISEETKLLSLNASIEAARAGEAGKGFAVVASEIAKLSEQSADGAEMIKNLAQTIMKKSQTSVELADGISILINEEQQSITDTQRKYEELSNNIGESVSKIKHIADKTDDLNNYKEKVLDNVSDLSAISEENYASCEEVSANISEIITEVRIVSDNCYRMTEMAKELEESASYFHN